MKLRRRQAIGVAVMAGVLLAQDSTTGQSAVRPNIVVIMTDDLNLEWIGTLMAKGMMPNLSTYFVNRGYNFTEAFAVGSFGSATRATFLTGQYPHNHGEFGLNARYGDVPRFNESSTVATWLRAAGYRTGYVGRYLTGYGWFTDPRTIPPGWDDWNGLIDPGTWSMEKYSMNINGTVVDFGALANAYGTELYQTDVVSVLGGSFIQRAASGSNPFFLVVNPVFFNRDATDSDTRFNVCPVPGDLYSGGNYWGHAQRPPLRYWDTIFGDDVNFPLLQPPNFNEADVTDKPEWLSSNASLTTEDLNCLTMRYWRRLEALRAIDDLVGHVMRSLEGAGALNNTVAIFTSDQGFMDGHHRFGDKSPAYQESIRVPLVVRTPWNTVPRQVSRMVLNTDLAPTIARLALATPTHQIDGRSILPLLQNPTYSPWRTIALFEHLIGPVHSANGIFFPPDYAAVRTDWPAPRLFVRYPTVTSGMNGELYDLSIDPYELENRYADPARSQEVSRLQQWLGALTGCSGLTCYILETYYSPN
jgi:N-acetylglucosamine-6-sulfatase